MEDNPQKKSHSKRHAGRKFEKKKGKVKHEQELTARQRNPKAFAIQHAQKTLKTVQRTQDLKAKKHHIPIVDRTPVEPPPIIVGIVGPPKVGKTTLMQCLIKNFTRQKLSNIQGPVTVVSGKHRRITFIECKNDINSMIDIAKVADLVLLLVDASFGFEMETFEFLNICQVHGFPRIMGVLTHLDYFRDNKRLRKTKKRLKHRFWTEVYQGAKLFYLSGMINSEYQKTEIHNLSRFISVMKFRPLTWRTTHPYILADRMEDLTDPELIRKTDKCDRTVCLYGYVHGTHMKNNISVHVPGCGDFAIQDMQHLPDPCPTPDNLKKRSLSQKDRVIYAPMSGVGGIVYDKDAVYIDLGGSHHHSEANKNSDEPANELVSNLMTMTNPLDEKMISSNMTMFSDAITSDVTRSDSERKSVLVQAEDGRIRRRAVFDDDDGDDANSDDDDDSDDDQEDAEESDEGIQKDIVPKKKKKTEAAEETLAFADSDDDLDLGSGVNMFTKSHDRVHGNSDVNKSQGDSDEEESDDSDGEEEEEEDVDENSENDGEEDTDDDEEEDDSENDVEDLKKEKKRQKKTSPHKLSDSVAMSRTLESQSGAKKVKSRQSDSVTKVDDESDEDYWDDDEDGKKKVDKENSLDKDEEESDMELGEEEEDSEEDEESNEEEDVSGDDDNIPLEDAGEGGLHWKSNLTVQAAEAFRRRQGDRINYRKMIYGQDAQEDEKVEAEEDEDGLAGLFRVLKDKNDRSQRSKSVTNHTDCSKFTEMKSHDWTLDDVRELIADCFITGKWEGKDDAETLLKQDDELYGDFEDLETGEVVQGKEDSDGEEKEGGEEKDGGEVKPATEEVKKKKKHEMTGQERREEKKRKLKEMFDSQYDMKGDTEFYDAWKAELEEQAKLNRSEFEQMEDNLRVQYEGYRPGMYVRVEINSVPCEFVTNFDPTYPLIVGGLLSVEENVGYVQVRIKKHRWHKRILKTRNPLILSLGWRRFQTMPLYSIQDHNMRHRLLKYTPEHLHCHASFWGPITPQGTGMLAVESVAGTQPGFRIAATGVVTELDKSLQIVKKLKLTGTPYKIFKKTAFVEGMFNTSLEVAKFEGASIRTVSGVRGQIKKQLKTPEGAFRATFEDKIIPSDIVFLRTWYPVDVPQFYTPVTSLLLPADQKTAWQGMKTVGQLRREKNMKVPLKEDSYYKPVARKNKVRKPLMIPRELQQNLPFSATPKELMPQKDPFKRVPVIREPHEAKVAKLMNMLRTLNEHKNRLEHRTMRERAQKHQIEMEKVDARINTKNKERKKRLFRALGKMERSKNEDE